VLNSRAAAKYKGNGEQVLFYDPRRKEKAREVIG